MPQEYLKTRNSIRRRCESGKHPGKKEGETCSQYAKRLAAMIYYTRHGVTPQQAESKISLIEAVAELLGLNDDHENN